MLPIPEVKAGRSGMLLCTHFQPDLTIVEARGAVGACNADRLSDSRISSVATASGRWSESPESAGR